MKDLLTAKTSLHLVSIWVILFLGSGSIGCDDSDVVVERDPNETGGVTLMADASVDPDLDVMVEPDVGVADSAMPEVDEDMRPTVDPPLTPAVVVVKLGAEQTAAGVDNRLSCLVYAQNGQVIPVDPAWGVPRFDVRPLEGWAWRDEEASLAFGERAGIYHAECHFPTLGLRSDEVSWLVTPSSPSRVITRVERGEVEAGEVVDVSCAVYDDYENLIEGRALAWSLEPPLFEIASTPEDNTEDNIGDRARFEPTRSGDYTVTCSDPDAMGATLSADTVLVTPAAPAALSVEFVGGRSVFSVGDLIELTTEVTDQYGNSVYGAEVALEAPDELPAFGASRFYAGASGNHVIRARVIGSTLNDMELTATRFLTVEDGAPRVTCIAPALGAQTTLSSQVVRGQVRDLSEITSVTVNGVATQVNDAGEFSVTVQPTWGLNIVEVIAEDAFGEETLERCMFFASNTYLNEDSAITDVALLHLSQDAIDDGAPRSPIGSLGDLLDGVLNSAELVNTIDDTLSAQNPIVPNQCRATIPIFGGCAFSAGAEYRSLSVSGPNSVALRLESGGLQVDATIRGVTIGLRTTGTISQSGTVQLASARIVASLGVSLVNGAPRVVVRGTPSIMLGDIRLNLNINFSIAQTVINALLNTIIDAFEGLIRDQLSSALEDFITSEVDAVLSSALSSLDLSALGFNLNLPRPFGVGSYRLGLNFSMNRLNVSGQRLRIGLSSVVSSLKLHTRPLVGVPSPSGLRRVELSPGLTNDAAGAAHVSLFNSVLSRLWRGGFFDVNSLVGDGGEADLDLELLLPPAIELGSRGNQATLHFGPAVADVIIPALFDEPITLNIGGRATTSITLVNQDEINFGQIELSELSLSSPGFSMSAEASAAVESLLIEIVQALLDDALNSALPSFPIPDFALPSSLSVYGVPRNTRLGVRDLSLSQDGARLIVRGDLR